MKILGIRQYTIQKYQEGTNRNGIQLNYSGPQYYEMLEKLRKEDPMAYNRLQQAAAQSETSEISRSWVDADGKVRRSTNVGAGLFLELIQLEHYMLREQLLLLYLIGQVEQLNMDWLELVIIGPELKY